MYSCLCFLQYNGKLQQFGAVGNLLRGTPSATSSDVTRKVTEVILAAGDKAVAAFWEFTSSYFLCTASSVVGCNKLVSHVAFHLISDMASNENWQAAFDVYHCLRIFGISNLVKCECLPNTRIHTVPFAVEVCMKSANINVAVEVMRSQMWLSGGSQNDLKERIMCAVNVGIQCVKCGMFDEAIECIEALSSFVDEEHHSVVVSFGNNIVNLLLQNSRSDRALELCIKLIEANLCSLPSLSLVLQSQTEQEAARNLCRIAYKKGVYGSLAVNGCLLYTSPSPRDATLSRMPSSA